MLLILTYATQTWISSHSFYKSDVGMEPSLSFTAVLYKIHMHHMFQMQMPICMCVTSTRNESIPACEKIPSINMNRGNKRNSMCGKILEGWEQDIREIINKEGLDYKE